jgi:hypothetical protein
MRVPCMKAPSALRPIASLANRQVFVIIIPTSISCRFNIRFNGGFCRCAFSILISSLVFTLLSASWAISLAAVVSSSPKCLSLGKFLSRASGGCIGSYVAVASLPACLSIIEDPPGCSCAEESKRRSNLGCYTGKSALTGRKSVTS